MNPYVPPRAPLTTDPTSGAHDQHGSRCQSCGIAAPTRRVKLRQNIGALVLRFPRSVEGEMCRKCIDQYFWKYTLTTLFLGWWGVISFFCTLAFIPMNIAAFVSTRSLPPPPK